jgi:CRISPR-associated protein Csm3
MSDKKIQLKGRVFLSFDIESVTGLHIGGSDTGIEIGGVDKAVIRNPLTNQPYIPGSSLKGKMRSLLEKYKGLEQNQRIGYGYIHSCGADPNKKGVEKDYQGCDVCQVFGVPGEREFGTPTRITVRDVHMDYGSARKLNETGRTVLPYTEVKTEVSIDRVTSAANPRQIERVPAGTIFGGCDEKEQPQPAEIVYSLYQGGGCDLVNDVARLKVVVEGLQLLEDDYLGGQGTRGSGKVRITNIRISLRNGKDYLSAPKLLGGPTFPTLAELTGRLESIQTEIRNTLAGA